MAVGEKFLISAVARVLEPGCKVDHILVLEGSQGTGKSTAVRIPAGDWFTDQLAEMGSKDAAMQVRGSGIIELSELGLAPGVPFSGAAPTTSAVTIRIGNASVTPAFAGLSGAGLYQINLTVPSGLGTGDISLQATVGGIQTPSGVVISLQ